ncbi:E3 ubiquitin-protein ligase E3D-like [Tubulanus polymorphus]|uniref:E3 ubiquitin-protein ligase E3D-like n=1 Tax=Tubulanus polymorphus TaxID=672921 RepID=UPI003DA67D17
MTENECFEDLFVYIDVKPRLSVAQVAVHGQNISQKSSGSEISVFQDGLSISKGGKTVTELSVKDFSMLPLTCSGLQFTSSQELQWRVQINKFKEQKLSDIEYIDPSAVDAAPQQTDLFLFQQSLFQAKCQNCGAQVISRNTPFSRVLPLPSDDWTEIMENVYCCKHPTKNSSASECCNSSTENSHNSILPKRDECFVGDQYFSLCFDDVVEYEGLKIDGDCVICSRCRHILGKMQQYANGDSTFQIRHHSIRITHSMTPQIEKALSSKDFSSEVYISRLLVSQVKIHNNRRFIIECKINGKFKPYILLWFIDKDAHVCSKRISTSMKQIDLIPEPVIKILYNSASKNTRLCELWMKDSTVHCIDLPHSLCLLLMCLLIDSTKILPPSLRFLNDFHVGHLRR